MALGLAVLTAAGLLTVAGPVGSAEAASRCTGRKVRTLAFPGGAVHVHRNGRRVCAVTVREKRGTAMTRKWVRISVRARGGVPVVREGPARRRSAPVSVHAVRRPVLIEATIGSADYRSGWIRV